MPRNAGNRIEVKDLLKGLKSRDRLSIARCISKVENRSEDLRELISGLFPSTGAAQILGITGPPGAGKSTIVDGLIKIFREQKKRVAVVAVDPSSPFSGGALLGDRIRMQEHYQDEGVFIRSLGTRGRHGGLSHAAKEVVLVLDAAGFDRIIVETAGVGQTELDVLKIAQSVAVVLVPESGDAIQVMKAGLMEIADIFAVNKSDRPEADKLVKEIVTMVGMTDHGENPWKVPVIKTEAVHRKGLDELAAQMESHQSYLDQGNGRDQKWRDFLSNEILDILTEKVSQKTSDYFDSAGGKKLLEQVLDRKIDPYSATDKIK